ncbi:hypothetical protein ACIQBJ_33260 [Kitasatospora sp. NPDC088391]|uniref:hypothetical protein n=1 Tax=Kitasatospora sp. NPDC088391 TaxID=3364074 RepID=UPI003830942B
MRTTVGAALRWAGHPGTVLAALVMVVNDRVGKPGWPGPVTGKLSDLGWLVVAPPLCGLLAALVLPRLRGDGPAVVGSVLAGLVFTVAKSSDAGAGLLYRACAWTGLPVGRTVADRTDLLALPVLAVSWWLWRDRSVWWPSGRRLWGVLAVPLVAAALVADTPGPAEIASRQPVLRTEDGQPVMLRVHHRWTTPDGGLHWTAAAGNDRWAVPADPAPPAEQGVCLPEPDGPCFRRTDEDRPVEVSADRGLTWRVDESAPRPPEWSTEPGSSASGAPASGPPVTAHPSRLVLADAPGGGHNVLAEFPDHYWGTVLVRTPDGRWSRSELPDDLAALPVEADPGVFAGIPAMWTVGCAGAAAAVAALRLARARPGHRWRPVGLLTWRQLVLLAWLPLSTALLAHGLPGVSNRGAERSAALLVSLLLTVLVVLPRDREARGGRVAPGMLIAGYGVLAGLLTAGPFVAWEEGAVRSWWAASGLAFGAALAATGVGLLLGVLLAVAFRERPRPDLALFEAFPEPPRPDPVPSGPPARRPARWGRHR